MNEFTLVDDVDLSLILICNPRHGCEHHEGHEVYEHEEAHTHVDRVVCLVVLVENLL